MVSLEWQNSTNCGQGTLWRPCSSTENGNRVAGLHTVSEVFVWQCCHETGATETSGRYILQSEKMDRAKRRVECPLCSLHLTLLDFYPWGNLKNIVCTRKPRTV
jgi:hypothetical protein